MKPKPIPLLKLQKGTLYSDQRDRAELEPKAIEELKPRCPKRFSKEEKKAWKSIAKMLENYGLLTIANAISMELLATAWVQYIACCQKMLESNEIIINGQDGGSMYNPHFNAQHKLGQLVSRYSQNLGLSSQSLAKIGSLMLKKKKEKDEFFND